jgi:hypothetical protein
VFRSVTPEPLAFWPARPFQAGISTGSSSQPTELPIQRRSIGGETTMDLLWTIAVILVILWLLGLVTSFTLGGFVHILLVLAIIVILIRVIQGRRPV